MIALNIADLARYDEIPLQFMVALLVFSFVSFVNALTH